MTNTREINASLPRRVEGTWVQDPLFGVHGDRWDLAISCPWVATFANDTVTWCDDRIGEVADQLIGQELLSVEADQTSITFTFTNASITATPDSDWDLWALTLDSVAHIGSLPRLSTTTLAPILQAMGVPATLYSLTRAARASGWTIDSIPTGWQVAYVDGPSRLHAQPFDTEEAAAFALLTRLQEHACKETLPPPHGES